MTSAIHDPADEIGSLCEGWTEVVLEDLVVHALGGDWGVPGDGHPDALPPDFVRVSVLRGTEFKSWDEDKGSTAAERAVSLGSLERRELRAGDLVVEISGGGPDQPVGRSLLIDEEALRQARNPLICANFCRQIRLHPDVDPAYVALVLRHRYDRGDLNVWQSQTTNIRNLDFRAFLAGLTIPVAPIVEQRRIVARATELLEQARQVRARVSRLPNQLRRFRQSVLADAFSGRITEDWRIRRRESEPARFSDETEWQVPEPLEIPEIPESWTLVALNDLVQRIQYGSSHKADGDVRDGVEVLRMSNIQEGRIDRTNVKHVDRGVRGLDAFLLKRGDILFNRTNSPGLVGKAAVWDLDREAVFASYLVRLSCDTERVLSTFLCSWINSPWGRQWARTVRRDCVSQSNINSSKLRRMPVPTPPLAEQKEIVRWVDNLFRFADAVDGRVAAALTQADRLSQAVLDKAFRGELVPTEVELASREGRSYEPAWALLNRIRDDRRRHPPRISRRTETVASLGEADRRGARGSRSKTVPVWDPDPVLIAFRQACWGAGKMTEDDLIRDVAGRLGVTRLGRKVRARLVEHLATAVERRIVARRGEVLEGATPTFARYDDDFLLQVTRSLLRPGAEHDIATVVRSVASHLGYGQVTTAVRNRMEGLFRTGVRRALLGLHEGRVWKRG